LRGAENEGIGRLGQSLSSLSLSFADGLRPSMASGLLTTARIFGIPAPAPA